MAIIHVTLKIHINMCEPHYFILFFVHLRLPSPAV